MLAIKWFENSYMKLNEDKCHFFCLDRNMKLYLLILDVVGFGKVKKNNKKKQKKTKKKTKQNLLGVIINKNLKFGEHILEL